MRRSRVLVAVTFTALSLPAIHAQRPRSGGDFQSVADAFAPSEILRQVTALVGRRSDTYNPFGPHDALDTYVATVWSGLAIPDRWDGHCRCESRLFETMGKFVLLRLEMAEWQYRYLLFVPPATGAPSWRLARYADTNVKYAAPAYRLDAMPGRSFLVLEHDTGGTGVYERGETWYDIAPGADGVALTLPIDGHDEVLSLRPRTGGAYVLQHEWKSNIVHRPEAAGDALRLTVSAKYTYWRRREAERVVRTPAVGGVRVGCGRSRVPIRPLPVGCIGAGISRRLPRGRDGCGRVRPIQRRRCEPDSDTGHCRRKTRVRGTRHKAAGPLARLDW